MIVSHADQLTINWCLKRITKERAIMHSSRGFHLPLKFVFFIVTTIAMLCSVVASTESPSTAEGYPSTSRPIATKAPYYRPVPDFKQIGDLSGLLSFFKRWWPFSKEYSVNQPAVKAVQIDDDEARRKLRTAGIAVGLLFFAVIFILSVTCCVEDEDDCDDDATITEICKPHKCDDEQSKEIYIIVDQIRLEDKKSSKLSAC